MGDLIYQCRLCSHKVKRYDARGYDVGIARIERHARAVHPEAWDCVMRGVYEALCVEGGNDPE